MKKTITVVICLLLMGAGMAVAADGTSFWSGLLKKLNTIVAHSPQREARTSVVGVRGAEEDSAPDALYWKGKEAPDVPVCSNEEISAFKAAVLLAEQGESQKALEAFSSFLADYPSSKLCNDAVVAIDWIKSNSNG